MTNALLHDRPLLFSRLALYAIVLIPLMYWSKLLFLHTTPKTYALYGLSELALLCVLWAVASSRGARMPLSTVGKLLLLYLIVIVLASIIGVDPVYSFWGSLDRLGGILTWLHLVLIFFLAVTVLRSPREWLRFFSFSTLVAIVVAFIHLLSIWGIFLIPEARGGSTFGNSTFFAVYLLFHFFFALYIAGEQSKKGWKIFWVTCAVSLYMTLTSVSAIAVQYSVIGGMVLFAALLLILTATKWKQLVGWFMLATLTISFMATSLFIFQPDSFLRQAFIERSSESRFALWNSAWEGIRERPLLGWGLENFSVVSLAHYNPCLGSIACGGEMWFDRAHNKVLDVWIESGVIGLVSYLSLFAAALLALNGARKKKHITPFTFSIFVSALVTYFIQNLTALDTNTSLLFWILILAFSSVMNANETKKQDLLPALVPSFATIFIAGAFFFFVIQPLRGNLAFAQTLNATSIQERVEMYQRTTTLSPLGIDMRRSWLAVQTEGIFWNISPDLLKNIESTARIELELAQAGLKESLDHNKNQELRTRITLGIMYQTEGHFFDQVAFTKAETILLEAIKRYPLIPQPKWTLAGVYLDEGKLDEALALTQSVLDASPLSPQAYNYQLIVLKWKGDNAAFEELAQQAVKVVPSLKSDIDVLRVVDLSTQSQEILTLFHR